VAGYAEAFSGVCDSSTLDFQDMKGLHKDMKAVEDRLEQIEKGQDRFRVRIALLETRQKDLTDDLAAIARVIEAAGLVKEKR
jgi:hypothetical protein